MKNKWQLFVLFVFLFASACKTTKVPSESLKRISTKTLDNKLTKSASDFDWFSAKVKMKYDDGNTSQSFSANIRFKKDSIVWMSLTGMFGIEGGRVLITKDSIQIIDRLNKQYHKHHINYIENYVPFNLTISDIQQVLLGNRFVPFSGKKKVSVDQNKYLVSSIDKNIESSYWVYPKNYTYAEMRLKDNVENRQLLYKFDDYKKVENKLIAFVRSLQFRNDSNNINLDMSFSKIRVNEPLNFPFEVSSKYK